MIRMNKLNEIHRCNKLEWKGTIRVWPEFNLIIAVEHNRGYMNALDIQCG